VAYKGMIIHRTCDGALHQRKLDGTYEKINADGSIDHEYISDITYQMTQDPSGWKYYRFSDQFALWFRPDPADMFVLPPSQYDAQTGAYRSFDVCVDDNVVRHENMTYEFSDGTQIIENAQGFAKITFADGAKICKNSDQTIDFYRADGSYQKRDAHGWIEGYDKDGISWKQEGKKRIYSDGFMIKQSEYGLILSYPEHPHCKSA
jgi:hypothetical protein